MQRSITRPQKLPDAITLAWYVQKKGQGRNSEILAQKSGQQVRGAAAVLAWTLHWPGAPRLWSREPSGSPRWSCLDADASLPRQTAGAPRGPERTHTCPAQAGPAQAEQKSYCILKRHGKVSFLPVLLDFSPRICHRGRGWDKAFRLGMGLWNK